MYFGAGLTILSAVVFFATKGQLADALSEAVPGVDRAIVEREVNEREAQELIRTALGVGLWIWMAVKNGEGRRWARVVATVFGLIYLVALTFTISFVATVSRDERIGSVVDYTVPYIVLGSVMGLLALVTLIQLYRDDSTRYYDERARWDAAVTLYGR